MNTATLQQWWEQRNAREKWALRCAVGVLAAALLWTKAIAPAMRTLRSFDMQHAALDAQLQTMLALQAQAQALQAMPRMTSTSAAQALRESVQKSFANQADVTLNGGLATVNLRGVSADALAQWLAVARSQAHTAPTSASLRNGPSGWSGTLQMALPESP
jgi:general secretion pathway protein M